MTNDITDIWLAVEWPIAVDLQHWISLSTLQQGGGVMWSWVRLLSTSPTPNDVLQVNDTYHVHTITRHILTVSYIHTDLFFSYFLYHFISLNILYISLLNYTS